MPLKLAANDGRSKGSMSRVALKLYVWFINDEQWVNTRVYAPES